MKLTSAYAREYFKNKGLSYNLITEELFDKLKLFFKIELNNYVTDGDEHSKKIAMCLSKKEYKINKPKFNHKDGLLHGFIQVDGSYFKNREAISFNENGFIGFAGWSDSNNIQPIIKAFINWCDSIVLTPDTVTDTNVVEKVEK